MKTNIVTAEFLGTFLLVFVGCGAIVVNDLYAGALGHIGVNAVFGPALAAMNFEYLWISIIAPVVGMWMVSPFCRLTQGADCCPPDKLQGAMSN